MKIYFNDEQCDVLFSLYSDDKICITVKGVFTNQKLIATVYDRTLKENEVLIKNYSENQGIEEALISGGVINLKPKLIMLGIGATNLKIFNLSSIAQKEIKFMKKLNRLDLISKAG